MRLNAVVLALLCTRRCVEKKERPGGLCRVDPDDADIGLDDLTSPQLTEVQGNSGQRHRFGAIDTPIIAVLCTEQSSYASEAVFVVDGASDCV